MNSTEHAGKPPHFRQFPKVRPPFPDAYLALPEHEYLANRTSGGFSNRMACKLESWMHVRVRETATKRCEEMLELGAGFLNNLICERDFSVYDLVEPFRKLFEASGNLRLIRHVHDQLSAVPPGSQNHRTPSVAVREHMLDLPREIALACVRLRDGGVFCAGVVSEGGGCAKWHSATEPARHSAGERISTTR